MASGGRQRVVWKISNLGLGLNKEQYGRGIVEESCHKDNLKQHVKREGQGSF